MDHLEKIRFMFSDRDMYLVDLAGKSNQAWPYYASAPHCFPATWPKNEDEFHAWVLKAHKANSLWEQSTIRYAVCVPMESGNAESSYTVAGFIATDPVTSATIDLYPGAEIGDVNVSYMILPEFQNKGLAAKAVREVLTKHIWNDGGNPIIRISNSNIPSQKVAHKLGFTKADSIETATGESSSLCAELHVYRRLAK